MLNLDTHMLLYALAGELKPKEHKLLLAHSWGISAIVLWEISKLLQQRRIAVDLADRELGQVLRALHVWPVSFEVCRAVSDLDVHGDAADELIAATSVVHRAALVTRDRRLLKSKLVPLAR